MTHKFFHRLMSSFLALAVMFAGVTPALAADGSLDPTFGTGGIVTTDFGGFDGGSAAILQPDGKIIVAGSNDNGTGLDFALARYNSDGSMDTTFNIDGMVITAFGSGHDIARAVALQPDGKILAAGDSFNGSTYDFALVRYNGDGSLDATFGTEGKVVTDLSAISRININTTSAELIENLPGVGPTVAQWIVDYRNEHGPFESIEDILNVTGVGPILFGLIEDLITVGSNDAGNSVALQPDGKILLAGYSFVISDTDFALARYNHDGSMDTTFGAGGAVTTAIGSYFDYGMDMGLQADGKIIVAGYSDSATFGSDFTLARYNSDGSLDTSLDGDGKVITDFNPEDFGFAVALQPDGKIILAGSSSHSNDRDFALLRYNRDGSPDSTFDSDGKVMTDFGGVYDDSEAIVLQPDGRIVLAGHSGNTREDPRGDFALARYNTGGSLDTTFDLDGKVTTDFNSGSSDAGAAAVIQPNGKIIVAGRSDDDFALARYDVGASAIEVTIDIKPGRPGNRIELKKTVCKGDDNLYVAILTTPDFNANMNTDATSLTLGDPLTGQTASPVQSRPRDVDRDGDMDVALTFSLCELVTQGALNTNSTELVLRGMTLDGIAILGRDSVNVVGPNRPGNRAPVFIYPVDGQTLDYEGSYLFKVKAIPSAEGFLWGFFQNGVMVWENYRDEGTLSGNEYGIHPGSLAHSKFAHGDVEVWVRASINGQWTDATVITIHLQPRSPKH